MILRRNAASGIKRITSQEPLLPFLYNTRTIRNQHTDALSEIENSSNAQERRPRQRDENSGSRPSFRFRNDRREYEERLRHSENAKTKHRRPKEEEEEEDGLDLKTPRIHARRSEREEHIPFEHAAQETASIRDKISTSTMTPMEKKAFENLLSLGSQKAPKDKGRHRDRIEDVLKEAAKRAKQPKTSDDTPMPEALKKMQEKMSEDRSAAQKVLLENAVELDLQQVKTAFEAAQSDVELWQMLHEKVLSRVTQLRLEEPVAPKSLVKQKNRQARLEMEAAAAQESPWPGDISDELVITRTLPQHLVECQRQLSTTFPSSQLHTSLLPYLKSLGPTTFALATSTKLYNQHMRSLFKSQTHLPQIVNTLEEMEKEVYEFDDKTKDLIDAIRKRGSLARRGVYGSGAGALWRGERFTKATRAATFWADNIEKMMQEQALREAKFKGEDVVI